uniref:DUF1308 domain-containing protein n=1 Tax=Dracunculus medinensis TaxID=318479 RepID=A0A0N4UDB1_DRAME
LESVGAADRTLRHAEQYLTFASNFLIFFQPPSVIMEFVNKVPDVLAKKLTSLGVEVKGVEASLSDFINLPSVDSDDDFYQEILIPEPIRQKPVVIDTVNFDVSAVFVLISSMTEENGTNYRFRSSLLEMQAEEERKLPARPMLIEAMKDKRLIICRSAYNAVREIIKTVAGASEKKRAEIFLDKIEIVEDKLSQRIERLQTGLKITKRTKVGFFKNLLTNYTRFNKVQIQVIFGSGDFYKAVTATSNKHFVNAASQQGVSLAVILVQSRALSEQKQMELLER